MKSITILAAIGMTFAASTATSAASIEGTWRTASGATAQIAACGNAYCTTILTGEHKGKRIGRMAGSGNSYSGEITDPANGKTYSGTAEVSGNSLKLTGCALKIFCRSQTWTRR
ncbi:DUF2147 domain-containing protein [Jiella marina]|uniref:DUF2147 domain-containing protein n=1 Tax=Jiella sp. LLJ827 TaxID=2917712 RepID=UPI002100B648|nr:DUF2147 domain-containing protein [Jiella sp. LLJ827]MCQ0987181.1 DUF2147 domain-containing protein [Jiella sp. LLJ827]